MKSQSKHRPTCNFRNGMQTMASKESNNVKHGGAAPQPDMHRWQSEEVAVKKSNESRELPRLQWESCSSAHAKTNAKPLPCETCTVKMQRLYVAAKTSLATSASAEKPGALSHELTQPEGHPHKVSLSQHMAPRGARGSQSRQQLHKPAKSIPLPPALAVPVSSRASEVKMQPESVQRQCV